VLLLLPLLLLLVGCACVQHLLQPVLQLLVAVRLLASRLLLLPCDARLLPPLLQQLLVLEGLPGALFAAGCRWPPAPGGAGIAARCRRHEAASAGQRRGRHHTSGWLGAAGWGVHDGLG
jgi:hypothetical protein